MWQGPRLLVIVTHPLSLEVLMRGQLGALRAAGFYVHTTSAPGPELDRVERSEGVGVWPVPMRRQPSPLSDLLSLLRLVKVIRRFRPDIVNAATPKAGLLGMLAARFAGVPVRVYTLLGLRLETAGAASRRILSCSEQTASACAHHVVCVSESLRSKAVELGLIPAARAIVLGSGSFNGVDVERFRLWDAGERAKTRTQLGIPQMVPVLGFVGRLTRDKGIGDLAEVFFGPISDRFPNARLLLLGNFEKGDSVAEDIKDKLRASDRVLRPGFVEDSAPYHAAMDLLVFPSFREGFGNAPLEAAASGLPVAGYASTGTVDAVLNGITGSLVPTGDRQALAEAILDYLDDPTIRRRHGTAGHERAVREFRRELVWERWIRFYCELPGDRHMGHPLRGSNSTTRERSVQ